MHKENENPWKPLLQEGHIQQLRPPAPGEILTLSAMEAHGLRSALERVLRELEDPRAHPLEAFFPTIVTLDKRLHLDELLVSATEAQRAPFGAAAVQSAGGVQIVPAGGDWEHLAQLVQDEVAWLLAQASLHGDGMHHTGHTHNIAQGGEEAGHVHCVHTHSMHIEVLQAWLAHHVVLQDSFRKTREAIMQIPPQDRLYGPAIFVREELETWLMREREELFADADAITRDGYLEVFRDSGKDEAVLLVEIEEKLLDMRRNAVRDYIQKRLDEGEVRFIEE